MQPVSPYFSIIVPTFERPVQLATCLSALANLDYPRERFEVIIADDGSSQPTSELEHAARDEISTSFVRLDNAGPAAARNRGVAEAKGDYLAFTDDDCAPAPDWLTKLAARLTDSPNVGVGGQTLNHLVGNPYSAASQFILDIVYAHYNREPAKAHFLATNNLALSASQFRELGGFDASFRTAEDRDFCDRWLAHGYDLVYASECIVHHAHHLTLPTYWRQHFDYGRGAFRYYQARARRGTGKWRIDLSFYPHIVRHLLANAKGRKLLSLASLLLVWQMANLAGLLWERTNPETTVVGEHPMDATN